MDSRFSMVDVGEKPVTFRRAVAQGAIRVGAETFRRVRDRQVPKGDVLALAEVAGIQGAKRTAELLPLCHPLLVDRVTVQCLLDEPSSSVIARAEVSGTGKTGFEMEALTAVSTALLCVYDLLKALDPELVISAISLLEKEGGKSGHWVSPGAPTPAPAADSLSGVRVGVVVVSDRVSAGTAVDRSGEGIVRFFEARGARVEPLVIVADDRPRIEEALRTLAREKEVALVVATGGTGLSPRDVTPEAVEAVCDRLIPGFGELLRAEGARHTPMSWLSRSSAGLFGPTLVIALPGSRKAVEEGLGALEKVLPHALHIARGGDHGK